MKVYNNTIDDGIQGAHATFHREIEKIQFICPIIDIPLDSMSMRKKIVSGEIVGDDEEAPNRENDKGEEKQSNGDA